MFISSLFDLIGLLCPTLEYFIDAIDLGTSNIYSEKTEQRLG